VSVLLMKRKFLIACAALVALFVGLVLVTGLLKSSQRAAKNYYQVAATDDGRLIVHPPVRQTAVVMSLNAGLTNLPSAR
jgi:hypothetical protein